MAAPRAHEQARRVDPHDRGASQQAIAMATKYSRTVTEAVQVAILEADEDSEEVEGSETDEVGGGPHGDAIQPRRTRIMYRRSERAFGLPDCEAFIKAPRV